MKRFVEGVDRGQSTLFPECLEDWIGEDNPVRVIGVFVEELDLGNLGFSVSGWRVVRIDPERILVRRDVMERELLLEFTAPALPPPQPIPPSETDGFTDDLDS